MTINSVETLIVFLCIFGIWGSIRGPEREVWTLGGITLAMFFLFFGGDTMFEQLPVRLVAGLASIVGNQSGSNYLSAHPLQQPWTLMMLWLATLGLVTLAYCMGFRFANVAANRSRDFGNIVSGFVMGALNGLFICVFLFSQGGMQAGLNIQFPDSVLTRTTIAPLILVGIVITIIAVALSSRSPAKKTP